MTTAEGETPKGVFEPGDPGESALVAIEIRESEPRDVTAEGLRVILRRMPLVGRFTREGRLIRRTIRRGLRENLPPTEIFRGLEDSINAMHPIEPMRCDCGALLVPSDWRGRSIVRCGQCGIRWGVEVIDAGNNAMWQLDVPHDDSEE